MHRIDSVKQALNEKLKELYPSYTIYDEDIPQDFVKPSFHIMLTEQVCRKRFNGVIENTLTLDVAYYSQQSSGIRTDCLAKQELLLRELCNLGSYRTGNRKAGITDNVLHVTFTISYAELMQKQETKMQETELNTRMEE